MKKRFPRLSLFLALPVAAAGIWLFLNHYNPSKIDFSQLPLSNLDGDTVLWEEFAGKPIFVTFWATWCAPCLAEKPAIERLRQQLEPLGWVFLAISDEQPERLRTFAQKHPEYGSKILHLKKSRKLWGIVDVPHTYVVDANGKVKQDHVGSKNWDKPSITP